MRGAALAAQGAGKQIIAKGARAQTNMQVVALLADDGHRMRHRGSRGRGACACVVLVVYAKVRGGRQRTRLVLTWWGVFPPTGNRIQGAGSVFRSVCVLEDTSTMERTTASANCIDLEIINQTITIITGAEFCISDQDSVLFLVLDGLPIRQTLSILTTM